jgi:hypothetical protein
MNCGIDMARRVTVTFDDEVHRTVSAYAKARGITLGAATGELIRRARALLESDRAGINERVGGDDASNPQRDSDEGAKP